MSEISGSTLAIWIPGSFCLRRLRVLDIANKRFDMCSASFFHLSPLPTMCTTDKLPSTNPTNTPNVPDLNSHLLHNDVRICANVAKPPKESLEVYVVHVIPPRDNNTHSIFHEYAAHEQTSYSNPFIYLAVRFSRTFRIQFSPVRIHVVAKPASSHAIQVSGAKSYICHDRTVHDPIMIITGLSATKSSNHCARMHSLFLPTITRPQSSSIPRLIA
jgi:hypothetical protein